MLEKTYEVLEGQKISGKHRVYTEGEKFPSIEFAGNLEMALNGSEAHKIAPKIKEVKSSTKASTKKAGK